MFVHPTQAIEIFGDVSTPFGTLAILYMLQRGLAAIADLLVLCGPTFFNRLWPISGCHRDNKKSK